MSRGYGRGASRWTWRATSQLEFTDANHIGHLRSAILCCDLPAVTAYVDPHTFGLVVVDGGASQMRSLTSNSIKPEGLPSYRRNLA